MIRVAARAASLPPFYDNEPRFSDGPKKCFKTISAFVYGIDPYLVEVEMDVGSARMQDFNVEASRTTP